MRKSLLTLFGAILALSFISCEFLVPDPDYLSSSEVSMQCYVDGVLLKWPEVNHADSYLVAYDFETITVDKPTVFLPVSPSDSSQSVIASITPMGRGKPGTSVNVYAYTDGVESNIFASQSPVSITSANVEFKALNVYKAQVYYELKNADEIVVGKGDVGNLTVYVDDLIPSSKNSLKANAYIIYKDIKGKEKTEALFSHGVDVTVSTKGFKQVEGVDVESVTRRGAKITFTKYSDIDINGCDSSKVKYYGKVLDSEGNYVDSGYVESNEEPVFNFTNLHPGTTYTATVEGFWVGYEAYSLGQTGSTLFTTVAPFTIGTPTWEETTLQDVESPYTGIKVTFQKCPEDVNNNFLYDIQYYVLKSDIKYAYGKQQAKKFSELNGVITTKVNGGNTLNVALVVYDPSEDDDFAYTSTVVKHKLQSISEENVFGRLNESYGQFATVTQAFGESYSNKWWTMYEPIGKVSGKKGTIKIELSDRSREADRALYLFLIDRLVTTSTKASGQQISLAYINSSYFIEPCPSKSKLGVNLKIASSSIMETSGPKDYLSKYFPANLIQNRDVFNDAVYVYTELVSNLPGDYIGFSYYGQSYED